MAMNREQKRMMQRQGQVDAEGAPVAQRRQPQRPPQKQQKEERTKPAQFLREVRAELRKVAWPTRSEVINYSIITLVAIVVMTAFVALLDWGFGEGILWIIDR
ncbi:preprotein translocase subunit SecE [Actinomarinicola tropica]|uniref:Protein translocase subunit SecE n=2 Tax=Actinomarinicola tropica TaxID=2789776 RepID=A0A5Q2RJ26_9ACTN|nr:preprotein translocase subunit SecE [Actinomarinicola tropica]